MAAPATSTAQVRSRAEWWYLGAFTLSMLGSGIVLPLGALYLVDARDLSGASAGACYVGLGGAGLLVAPMAGSWTDKGYVVPTFVGGLLAQAAGFVAVSQSTTFPALFASLTLIGAGNGAVFTVRTPMIVRLFGEARVPSVVAAQYAAMNAAMGVGTFAGPWLVSQAGEVAYSWVFVTNAVTFVVLSIVVGLLAGRGEQDRSEPLGDPTPYRSVVEALRDPRMRPLLWFMVLVNVFALDQMNASVPVALTRTGHVPLWLIGALFAINTFAILLMVRWVSKLVLRHSATNLMRWSAVLWALAWGVAMVLAGVDLPLATQVGLVVLIACSAALADAIDGCVVQPLLVRVAPPERLGRYSAALSLCGGMSAVVAPGIGLLLLGFTGPILFWPVIALGCLTTLLTVPKSHEGRPRAHA